MSTSKLSAKTNKELLILLNYRLEKLEEKMTEMCDTMQNKVDVSQIANFVPQAEFNPIKDQVKELSNTIKGLALLIITAVVGAVLKLVIQ